MFKRKFKGFSITYHYFIPNWNIKTILLFYCGSQQKYNQFCLALVLYQTGNSASFNSSGGQFLCINIQLPLQVNIEINFVMTCIWYYHRTEPAAAMPDALAQNRFNDYNVQLGLTDKDRAIKGLVICNTCDVEPLDLLYCLALGCYQPSL